MRRGISLLQLLHQRFVLRREERQYAIDRRAAADRIAGVDHRLARERGGSRLLQRLERGFAGDREHHKLAERGGLGGRLDLNSGILRRPILELGGIAGADLNLMAMFHESRR